MKLKLPSSVYTAQDLTDVILEIKEYAKWYQHVSIKQKVATGQASEPPVISQAATELINEWMSEKESNAESFDVLIAALEEFKNKAPSVSITLAALPSNELKQSLTTWCRANLSAGALVNFNFDSTILGGIIVRYGSRIHDWSFRRQILAERNKFPEVLRRV